MIHIAICDDNHHIVKLMYDIVCDKFTGMMVPFKITQCFSGDDLLYQMCEQGDFDLIFLDVELGMDNGITIAAKIKEKNPWCYIIFLSGYNVYYKDAFSVQPFQFLDKPVKKDEVEHVIEAVYSRIANDNQVFAFEYNRMQYRIRLNDILYFTSELRRITFYTKDEAVYHLYGRMDEVEEQLNKMTNTFVRIHQSYLINLHYVKMLNKNDVVMQNNQSFPISARKRKNTMEQYIRFFSMNP